MLVGHLARLVGLHVDVAAQLITLLTSHYTGEIRLLSLFLNISRPTVKSVN